MKHAVVICALLCAVCGAAQPALPFPTGDVRWTVNSVEMGASYPSTTYATLGDTTFNGSTYRKIGWVENMGTPWQPEDLTYRGSLRDDDGRWLFVPANSTEEYPLFDFTGDVGDTVSIQNPGATMDPVDFVVEAISTVSTLVDERRMWTLLPEVGFGYAEYFIEGIGSPFGLFGHSTFISDAGAQLICMEQDGEIIYRIPEAETCYYIHTSIADHMREQALQVSPNPARDRITLAMDGSDITRAGIAVNDALGRAIPVSGLQRAANTLHLDVSGLPAGLYTVSIVPPGRAAHNARLMVER